MSTVYDARTARGWAKPDPRNRMIDDAARVAEALDAIDADASAQDARMAAIETAAADQAAAQALATDEAVRRERFHRMIGLDF